MSSHNIDPIEIAKFSDSAPHWWDTEGEFKMLHALNPLRLQFIQERVSLENKLIIDIGCGGGILTESLAKKGARVTGIDMSEAALNIAKLHQHESGTEVEYLQIAAEDIAAQRAGFYDIVTCFELLEHVPDPSSIISACAQLVKPGGYLFFSTINRNVKSYLFAIVGAEYLLKLLPKNTHDFSKFIRPSEFAAWARKAGLTVKDFAGISYDVLSKQLYVSPDVSVNYLVCCRA